ADWLHHGLARARHLRPRLADGCRGLRLVNQLHVLSERDLVPYLGWVAPHYRLAHEGVGPTRNEPATVIFFKRTGVKECRQLMWRPAPSPVGNCPNLTHHPPRRWRISCFGS